MNRDDIRKLLGGYATGTLTPEEQQALFDAALDDQELFDALAREQPLCDLLRDPAAKAHILAALDQSKSPWYEHFLGWKPAVAGAAVAAMAAVLAVVLPERRASESVDLAQVRTPPPAAEPAPPAAPPHIEGAQQAETRKAPGAVRQSRKNASKPPAEPRQFRPPQVAQPGVSAGALSDRLQPPPPPPPAAETAPPPSVATAPPVETPERVRALPQPAGFAGGVVGGILPAGQPPNARDLFYATTGRIRPPEQDAANAPKAEAKQRNALPESRAALGAAPGLMRTASLPAPANLGVKYTILRKPEGGDFVEATPGNLKSGDTVALRFESNASGYLLVESRRPGGMRQVFAGRLERQVPHTTPPLLPSDRELVVTFSRQPRPGANASLIRTQEAAGERATYVVSDRASAPVVFTINLDYK